MIPLIDFTSSWGISFSCFSALLVIFNWMPNIVSVIFLSTRFFFFLYSFKMLYFVLAIVKLPGISQILLRLDFTSLRTVQGSLLSVAN